MSAMDREAVRAAIVAVLDRNLTTGLDPADYLADLFVALSGDSTPADESKVVEIVDGHIDIMLRVVEAEWLVRHLPSGDGLTMEIAAAIETLGGAALSGDTESRP